MTIIKKTALALLLLAGIARNARAAGHHQICYQDLMHNGYVTASFECRSDDPNVSCSISAPGSTINTWVGGSSSLKKWVAFGSSGTFTAQITFSDGVSRNCTVNTIDPSLGAGMASAGATLVGYTTDASGLLTTGVWTHHSNQNVARVYQTITLPYHVVSSLDWATSAVASHPSVAVTGRRGDFALVGVGAYVDYTSYGWAGSLLWKLQPRPDLAGVEVASKDHFISSPSTVTGYAVGLQLVAGPVPVFSPPHLRFP